MSQPLSWRLTGAIGQIRVATFQERNHLVVPVVALVEGVLHPANTQNPEFVPSEVINHAPQGWNGRPVVLGHPKIGADFVSANSPDILEKEGIGVIFNAEIQKEKLVLEAWIDKERATKQGVETEELIQRLEAGQMTEVSIGALVSAKKILGNHKGKQYHAIWQHIVPDHLAFLHKGDIGACSNDAGCGAPRVAMHLVTAQGFQLVGEPPMADPVTPPEEPKQKTLRERLSEMMKFVIGMAVEDMSDRDLRSALERALGAEPGFLGIDSVFPSESKVIYAVGSQQTIQLFSREYSFAKNGDIKLAAKAEEVQPVTRFEPVNAQSHGCGCAGGGTMNVAQRIKALIESGRFKEEDRSWLEKVPEDRLSTLEQAASPQQPTTPAPQAPSTPAPSTPAPSVPSGPSTPPAPSGMTTNAAMTAEQYINQAPTELQDSLREGLRVQQERRSQIITSLKGTGRCDFTDEQLAAMPTPQLERLLKLADAPAPVVYGGRLSSRTREEQGVPPPPNLTQIIQDKRKRA